MMSATRLPARAEAAGRPRPVFIAILSLAVFLAAPAQAERPTDAESHPRLDGEIVIEVQNDYAFKSDDRDAARDELFTTTEPEVRLRLFPGFQVVAHGVLEPVLAPDPGEDRAFGDHGIYLEELYAAYIFAGAADIGFEVHGGKFNPGFGIAWDAAPGIYGTDFAEDYEITERIGIGGSLSFGLGPQGPTTLGANAFFVDTTVLSQSGITNRGRRRLADGGAGNTGRPTSFSLTLDGEAAALPGLAYHLGMQRQARGKGDSSAETGVAVGARLAAPIGVAELTPLFEIAYFDGIGGVAGTERTYLTAGASLAWQRWTFAVSHTSRLTREPGPDGADIDDALIQVSAGYEFENGLTAAVGYRWSNETDIETHIVGVLVAYRFDF